MKKLLYLISIIYLGSCSVLFTPNEMEEVTNFPDELYNELNTVPKVTGNTFYIDPVNGSIDNDGSFSSPWSTLEEVISANLIQYYNFTNKPYKENGEKYLVNPGAPVKGGDELVLYSGDHGAFVTGNAGFYMEDGDLTIRAELGHEPVLSSIDISSASHIYIDGISIKRYPDQEYDGAFIRIYDNDYHGNSEHIRISNCYCVTVADIDNWVEDNWINDTTSGAISSSDWVIIENCTFENVSFGIAVYAHNNIIYGNEINRFSGDSLRGCGSNLIFQENEIYNSFLVNENHDDGFQSFLTNSDNQNSNVILKGNFILSSTDRNRNMLGTFQGIGCFDGPYENWTIEDNIIITDHWHGISLYGGSNSTISNNIAVPLNWNSEDRTEGPPVIRLDKGKDGTIPTGSVVKNNISTGFYFTTGVENSGNTILSQSDKDIVDDIFYDYDNMDFRLK